MRKRLMPEIEVWVRNLLGDPSAEVEVIDAGQSVYEVCDADGARQRVSLDLVPGLPLRAVRLMIGGESRIIVSLTVAPESERDSKTRSATMESGRSRALRPIV